MKQKSLLKVFFLLCALIVGSTGVWGAASDYSAVYTSNCTLTGGTNGSACKVRYSTNGTQYDGIKVGTSSAGGSMTITVPSGTKYLHIHVSAWNGVTGLSLNITPNTYSSTTSISLTSDSGISGNSPFTFSGNPTSSNFYKVITFTNALTAETTLTFTTSTNKRFVIWGVNAEAEPTGVTIKNGNATITSLPMTLGDDDVTLSAVVAPALAYQTVTWSSDNTSVATVSSAGVVSAKAAGTANIKATSSLSSVYGTCVVTVSTGSDPAATVSTSSLAFGDVEVGQEKELTFKVTPANLESELSIACNNNKYTVSPTSIAQNVTTEQTITVTAAPTALNDDMDGEITISGGGLASNRTVELSASPYQVANVTLSATNGVIKQGETTKTSITSRVGNSATLTAVPNSGYLFDGWTATGATPSSSDNVEEEFTFTSTTPVITANFIVDPNVYVTIDEDDIDGSTNTKTGYGTEKVITKDGYTWSHNGYQTSTDYDMIQLRLRTHNSGISWIKLPTFPGKIEKIDFVVTGAGASSRSGDKTTTRLFFQAGNTSSEDIIKNSNNDESNSRTIDLTTVTNKYNTGYITAGAGIRIWEITVAYRPATVTAAGWGTYVAPCAVEFESGDAYVVSAASESTTLKEVTSVPQGTPVLLKGAGAKNISVVASATAPASNLLKVSDGTIEGDDTNIYVLARKNDITGFYLWSSTADPIPSGKVYLDTKGVSSKGIEYFSLDDSIIEESETNGIKAATVEGIINGQFYNLAGQRVSNPTKGLYIVNGKKVIIK